MWGVIMKKHDFIFLFLLLIILISISFGFSIFVVKDIWDKGEILDKAIGYFGALGLPAVLFYWEWKRDRDKKEELNQKIYDHVNKLQKDLTDCFQYTGMHFRSDGINIFSSITPKNMFSVFNERLSYLYPSLSQQKMIYEILAECKIVAQRDGEYFLYEEYHMWSDVKDVGLIYQNICNEIAHKIENNDYYNKIKQYLEVNVYK